MSTRDHLRELTRQARLRLGEADRMKAEHRLITAQSDRRLAESRRLLDQCELRGLRREVPSLREV